MRLIDADELKKRMCKLCNQDYSDERCEPSDCVFCNAIKSALTVDAVPVVRCRECKYFNLTTHECENECLSTDHEGGASYSLNFYDDDFCSYGERRGKQP